jgi:histidine ammonia-lyase
LRPGPGTAAALRSVRERIAGPGPDVYVSPDLAAAEALVASGTLLAAVQSSVGALR